MDDSRGIRGAITSAAAFFAALLSAVAFGGAPVALLVAYALLSAILFAVYGVDKVAARKGAFRTPEVVLHFVALIGGWPGALVAQRVFRHKTRKRSFQAIFWCTVVANCLASALLLAGPMATPG